MLTEGSYEARIAGVVRRHLKARFGDWISFDAVMVVLRTDQWDEESIHVYVVYDGDGEPLDLRWLSGIRNRMRRELRDLGRTSWWPPRTSTGLIWPRCWTGSHRRRRRPRAGSYCRIRWIDRSPRGHATTARRW